MMASLRYLLLLALLASAACDSAMPAPAAPGEALPPTRARPANTPAPSRGSSSLPTAVVNVRATPSPPATPSATATPTSEPAPRIAVPASWQTEVKEAGAVAGDFRWGLIVSDDPEGLVARGQADVALVPGTGGIPAGQRPLVLAVPFDSQWIGVTTAEANTIREQGHSLVDVLPWDRLEPEQRGLLVDGRHPLNPDYPLQQPWSLVPAPGYEAAAEALAQQLRERAEPSDFSLVAVGDIMLDRALGRAIANGDLGLPFAQVQDVLSGGDVTLGNLECALGDAGAPEAKSYTFRAPPAAAHSLADAGIDIVSLANNHALDFGPAALTQGIRLLGEAGVATIGAGENEAAARAAHVVEVRGTTLAFLAYVHVPVEGNPPYFDAQRWSAGKDVPGVAWAHPDQIREDVSRAGERADHVIVTLHSGYEYAPAPSPPQRAAARAAIEAGATLVIGHHAHVLQGVEFYGGGVIVYGLGNFAFTISGPPETAILEAFFDENGLHQLRFVPAIVQSSGQPRLADEVEAAAIRGSLFSLTAGLN